MMSLSVQRRLVKVSQQIVRVFYPVSGKGRHFLQVLLHRPVEARAAREGRGDRAHDQLADGLAAAVSTLVRECLDRHVEKGKEHVSVKPPALALEREAVQQRGRQERVRLRVPAEKHADGPVVRVHAAIVAADDERVVHGPEPGRAHWGIQSRTANARCFRAGRKKEEKDVCPRMLQRRLFRAVLQQNLVTCAAPPPSGTGPRAMRAPGALRGPPRRCPLRAKLGLQGVLLPHETHRPGYAPPANEVEVAPAWWYRTLNSPYCLAAQGHVPGRAAPKL